MSAQNVAVEDFSYFTAQQLAAALPMYRLTAAQYDVWHTMLGAMERGGWVRLTLEEIAARLGAHAPNISTALSVLREHGLLWREGVGCYRVNPRVAFKGSVEEWNEALASIPADVPEVVIPQYTRRPPRAGRRRALSVA